MKKLIVGQSGGPTSVINGTLAGVYSEGKKKGFSIPISKWLLEKDIRDWAEALLDKDKIRQQGLLNPDVVEKIWRDFTDRGIYRIQIWYILMFQQWMETEYRNN